MRSIPREGSQLANSTIKPHTSNGKTRYHPGNFYIMYFQIREQKLQETVASLQSSLDCLQSRLETQDATITDLQHHAKLQVSTNHNTHQQMETSLESRPAPSTLWAHCAEKPETWDSLHSGLLMGNLEAFYIN